MADSLPCGGAVLDADELTARWSDAWSPAQVAERLEGISASWCVAAGWALDLFRGEQSRPHGDLEIAVPAAGFPEIRDRFPEYACDAVGSGRVWAGTGPGSEAWAEAMAATHQTWLRDPVTGRFLFDVFREPHEGGTWICRRDETLRLPYDTIIERTTDGIPFLVPELVLLFKAKAPRTKDRADFDGVLPLLGRARRARLGEWLEHVHPGHPWLMEPAMRDASQPTPKPVPKATSTFRRRGRPLP
ncbi:nucleotidyltransferase domain-containing protein [Streptomyces sp. NPDC017435]|uniref:nucleotidyltransferase domain-containing protein n=1 Tax=Streptomyces sp. NPDC017435 TaxID=3364995 RepID=UPI0037943921